MSDWERYMRVRELEAENEQLRLRMLLESSVPRVATASMLKPANAELTNALEPDPNYSIQCTETGDRDKMKKKEDEEDSGIGTFSSFEDQSRGPLSQCTGTSLMKLIIGGTTGGVEIPNIESSREGSEKFTLPKSF